MAPVGEALNTRVGPVAELPEEHDGAEDGRHRHQVEQHGLQRQQHRPEGADQQQEREQQDQRQHVGKLLVHRVEVVLDARADTGDPDLAVDGTLDRCPDVVDHGPGWRCPRWRRSAGHRRWWCRPGRADDGQLHPVDAAGRLGCRLRVAGRHQHLDGGEDSGADAAVGQRLQRVVARAAARQRLDARLAELDAEHRDDEQGEHDDGHRGGGGAVPDDEPRPRRPAARRGALVANAGVVDARPDAGQQRRQQREDGGHAHQRDQQAGRAPRCAGPGPGRRQARAG